MSIMDMSSVTNNTNNKINSLFQRLQLEKLNVNHVDAAGRSPQHQNPPARPSNLGNFNIPRTPPQMKRPNDLNIRQKQPDTSDIDRRFKEIMQSSGKLKINNVVYDTDIKEMEYLEDLGSGTCGHVVKMRHKPSGEIIAVKQMRRSVNTEENKRIVMDIEVVIKSYDCNYIVQCLGCFITDSEVWICMELMSTCFDKLLKRLQTPIPETVLGKVVVATVNALAYLKDKHGVIHRDVKPSNILVDERENVKLCDFGISGRLVDSRAKTRSAGCAAYMAPERIDLHNPDYDIRADVWSLGITLIELATGVLPYQDCKNDFEVLSRVIVNDPPSLPTDKYFSPMFRDFVSSCLIKDKENRPKYAQLKAHSFIKKYERDQSTNNWFKDAIKQAETIATANKSTPRHTPELSSQKRGVQVLGNKPYQQLSPPPLNQSIANGGGSLPPDGRAGHISRLSTFQSQSSCSPNGHRSFSPMSYTKSHQESRFLPSPGTSPILQRKPDGGRLASSPFFQRKNVERSPIGSPLPLRSQSSGDDYHQHAGGVVYSENNSPIVLQRFYHQQKQQQQAKEEENGGGGKKRFGSYMKLHLSNDRTGRNSRHQSPEPPPRLNRTISGDQSPLALRRNYSETSASPNLSRRYISPTPPVPPPRRLSESTSVPGSPQHLRARIHYTPEPQRRPYPHDVS
ncbi:dual specificity mitogen-activated protein kinase kinase 7-like [Onthophagus taurus]|uniref:dual specificity mitogen-activated protein kinase kinase 7-like n=1 Tax=Onthophagus taurus TaxID=166361 RepID=UPI000C1FF1F5|nr:dual specificity mitogen-activated protein kinase kinase 7-like [Onthophagus taurus]